METKHNQRWRSEHHRLTLGSQSGAVASTLYSNLDEVLLYEPPSRLANAAGSK